MPVVSMGAPHPRWATGGQDFGKAEGRKGPRAKGETKRTQQTTVTVWNTDAVFASFAQPGVGEDAGRSAKMKASPNFAMRPSGSPKFTPVEMQTDYETGKKNKEPWGITAEGFGELGKIQKKRRPIKTILSLGKTGG